MFNHDFTELNCSQIIENLMTAGIDYVEDNPSIESMVLGVSGGVDSAVTAFIASEVAKFTGVGLIGYSMPILTNKPDELMRAEQVGKEYCDFFETKPLGAAFLHLAADLEPEISTGISCGSELSLDEKIRAGNMKARVRMIHLYNQASKHKGMVLSTDNLTELLMGFWTLHGDVGDFGFIQNLWKTEVFRLARYIGGSVAECADAKPTDGLGVSDSDLDQLLPGWEGSYIDGYRMVDEIMIDQLKYKYVKAVKPYLGLTGYKRLYAEDHPVVIRYKATEFKRANPTNLSRDTVLRR